MPPQVQPGEKLEKIEKVEPPQAPPDRALRVPPAPRSGEDVATLKRVSKRYGSRTIYDALVSRCADA